MPPHLHPRSRMTSSLFATTVAACFFVVALPHILPCPAPRVTYADASGGTVVVLVEQNEDGTTTTTTRQRRRRKAMPADEVATRGIASFSNESSNEDAARLEALTVGAKTPVDAHGVRRSVIEETARTRDRECPVPKPGGVLGELLGYVSNSKKADTTASRPGTDELSNSISRSPSDTRTET